MKLVILSSIILITHCYLASRRLRRRTHKTLSKHIAEDRFNFEAGCTIDTKQSESFSFEPEMRCIVSLKNKQSSGTTLDFRLYFDEEVEIKLGKKNLVEKISPAGHKIKPIDLTDDEDAEMTDEPEEEGSYYELNG
jgi:hypothetical protein